ncbi:pro-resilin-like [Cydia strobilella]|uniref:pro-resilin-like n=1 Tax=Cydia strobilella TaxID=1100964 RepID=UPI0030046ABC
MRIFLACTLMAVTALAEPPVDNRYLPPQQDLNGGFSPPSQSYGAPSGVPRQTDAVFGQRTSSTPNSRSSRPSNQYGPAQGRQPSSQYLPPQGRAQQPSNQYGPPQSRAQQPSNQYGPPQGRAQQPSNQYGPPSSRAQQPSNQYGPPQARGPSNQYAPQSRAQQPSSQYGPPQSRAQAPSNQYGPPQSRSQQPSNQYGPPNQDNNQFRSQPSSQYGAPAFGQARQSNQYSGQGRSPSNQYLPPNQSARQPSTEYGAPGFGTPSQEYGAPNGGQQFNQGGNFGDAQSRQYSSPDARGYGGDDDGSNGEPANYSFEYMVKDDESGNDFGHRESRMGDRAEGLYYVLLPDGRKQTVEYEADQDGYKPRISYEDTGAGAGAGAAGYDSNAQAFGQDGGGY